MRIRSLAFALLLCGKLFGNVENVEFLASAVQKAGDIITANGNVLLYSQNYLASTDSAKYYPWLYYSSPYTASGVTIYGTGGDVCDSY